MELTWKDDVIFILLIIFFLGIMPYGSYRLGKWQERKEYTKAFIHATELTYWEGFEDGEKEGKIKGDKQGYQRCLDEDYERKDRY